MTSDTITVSCQWTWCVCYKQARLLLAEATGSLGYSAFSSQDSKWLSPACQCLPADFVFGSLEMDEGLMLSSPQGKWSPGLAVALRLWRTQIVLFFLLSNAARETQQLCAKDDWSAFPDSALNCYTVLLPKEWVLSKNVLWDFKGKVTQKCNFRHELLHLKLFQTCIHFFVLMKKFGRILINELMSSFSFLHFCSLYYFTLSWISSLSPTESQQAEWVSWE